MTNVPINDGRCLLGKITNRNAKNVWILILRPGWNVGVDIELGKNLREVRSEFSTVQCGVCLNSVLNVKVIVGAFSQEKALVGVFFLIVEFQTS